MTAHAGLVVRARGRRWFVPAMLVEQVMSTPRLSAVPGSGVRMALVAGRVLPVVELGEGGQHLVVCQAGSEPLGLTGLDVEEGGSFEAANEGAVRVRGEIVEPLDFSAELLRVTRRPEPGPANGET